MNVPALLVAQTVPLAGIVLATTEDGELKELLFLAYFVVIGLMISLIISSDGFGLVTGWLCSRSAG